MAAGTAWAQPGVTPPTGPGTGPQAPPAPLPPPLTGVDANPLTPDEKAVLKDIEAEWIRYTGQSDEHHRRMRDLLLRAFNEKTAELEARYAKRIAESQRARDQKH